MGLIKICENLYVSGAKSAQKRNNIYKICVSDLSRDARGANKHYPIDEDDLPRTFIKYARYVAQDAYEQLKKGIPVLVYCHVGRNRSVSCCLYILAKYCNLTFKEAYAEIRKKHPNEAIMQPIFDFLQYRFKTRPLEQHLMKKEAKKNEDKTDRADKITDLKRKETSPKRRETSPKRRETSPKRHETSPKRRETSPKRRETSPKRR
jgi:hypothetical protein